MTIKVSPQTATYLLDHIRYSMTDRQFRRLTVVEVLELYRERKLTHLLDEAKRATP